MKKNKSIQINGYSISNHKDKGEKLIHSSYTETIYRVSNKYSNEEIVKVLKEKEKGE